jgi:Trypsin-like peptidase domain
MQRLLIGCSFLMIVLSGTAQNNYSADPFVETWQRITVSLGNIGQKEFNKKTYQYYNVLGTGVLFYITYKSQPVPVIITAKHVIKNKKGDIMDTMRVRFSWESNKSVYENLGYKIIIRHKDIGYYFELPDTSIDLVCIPLTNLLDSFTTPDLARIVPYSSFAKDRDYFEGRDVFTLGYPAGIGSKYWTRGLLRKGIISWLPDTGIANRKFIIDCNMFPGNSGGPVFSFPYPAMAVYDTTMYGPKFYGIVIERRLNYNDIYAVDGKTKKYIKADLVSPESMSVGIVEPAKNVFDLLKFTEGRISFKN